MKFRGFLLAAALTFLATGGAQSQQSNPPAAETSVSIIKVETRLVLVDTVVTDKKGNYIADLTAKDFKVFEDNKEQPIKSFSSKRAPLLRRTIGAIWCCFSTTPVWTPATRSGPDKQPRSLSRPTPARSLHGNRGFRRHSPDRAELHHRR